jgi:hypothetical protein
VLDAVVCGNNAINLRRLTVVFGKNGVDADLRYDILFHCILEKRGRGQVDGQKQKRG